MNNLTITDSKSQGSSVLSFRECMIDQFLNSYFSNLQFRVFHLVESTIINFENNTLDGIYKGFKAERNSVVTMKGNKFLNFRQIEDQNGARRSLLYEDGSAIGRIIIIICIEIINSNVTIDQGEFRNNSAVNGGAISVY